ncbi:MAG: MFS transporter [Streptosporangiales bacterium]|nr:MFS transporter [Streptosporangiales bacterium]
MSSPEQVRQIEPAVLRRSVAAGAIGVWVHWFDWAVYAYMSTTIATVFFPTQDATAGLLAVFAVFAVSFAIRPIGGLIFGTLGDRIGRRRTLVFVIILMSAATLAVGFLPSYASVGIAATVLLVVTRLIQGLAAGGEFGSAATFLAEYSPRKRRGFGVSWLECSSLAGFLSASLAVFVLSSVLSESAVTSWGWRIPFLLAAPMGIIGLYIRLKLDDTPEFKALVKADQIARSPLKELFAQNKRQLLQMTGIEILQHITFYTVVVYMLTYQTEELGLGAGDAAMSATVTSLVAMVLVPIFGGLSDRIGRKPLTMASAVGFVVLSIPLFLLMTLDSVAVAVLTHVLLGVLLALILSTHAVAMSEIFPTRVRQSGLSIGYNVTAAVFAGTVPYLLTYLISATGNSFMPAFYLVLAGAVGIVTTLTLPETRGRDLIQVSSEELSASVKG